MNVFCFSLVYLYKDFALVECRTEQLFQSSIIKMANRRLNCP